MNKLLIIAFALFAVISIVRCSDSDEVLEKVKSKHLRKYLTDRREDVDSGLEKLEKHCPGVSEKLKSALVSFQECDDKADDSLTLCSAIQVYTLNCTAPLLKVVDDCLPDSAKGLPSLGVKSILSVADYLCKQTGESIFELGNPCLWEDLEESNEQLDECEEKVKNFAKKHKETIPSKTEICSTATSLRTCVQTRATTTCKNQKTKNVALGVFDALVAPCSHINEV
ncbi:hypothetical protein MTP99_017319 [Tenebrio molitor]|jgi:hypothetical protein|uniref:28 kDa desiccation stress protein n=1 Tax=Tenebrio molitor TaxID=7067 RepID=Q27014_TENMO|nr:28 kDa desiccation stress protein [Tenebrio molitor]KAJ3626623.1 hypothetical protein MTP99_017104 [Tenebrio molitor]KAJ3626852.1 hypothetical protein MTP99_017319 [Tenebrio molitor]